MWDRFRALWGGRAPDFDDADEAAPAAKAPADRHAEALAEVDRALETGDRDRALALVRRLLLDPPAAPSVLGRAGRLMHEVAEPEIALLFERAAGSQEARPVADLALAFLAMDDVPLAAALARSAVRRLDGRPGPDVPNVLGVLAEALAREGDHAAVVDLLRPVAPRSSSTELLHRHALSALFAGDSSSWVEVAPRVGRDDSGAWLVRAALRATRFEAPPSPRQGLFVGYGAVLLDPEPAEDERLDPVRAARIVERAAEALHRGGAEIERVAYASSDGEVFAHWMARVLDRTAIPLAGRLQDQRLLAVAAGDHDLAEIASHRAFGAGPTVVLQVVKDPSRAGHPTPDLVGVLGAGVRLPLERLHAERAADRIPPRLQCARLVEEVGDAEDPDLEALGDWVEARAELLGLSDPPAPPERIPFGADLPRQA